MTKPNASPMIDVPSTATFLGVSLVASVLLIIWPFLTRSTPPNSPFAFVVALVAGLIAAAPTNFALFFIFGRTHWALKLGLGAAMAVLIFLTILLGAMMEDNVSAGELMEGVIGWIFGLQPHRDVRFLFEFIVAPISIGALLCGLMAVASLWAGKAFLGWRIKSPDRPAPRKQLAIWHLFVATGVAASGLPFLRLLAWVTDGDASMVFGPLIFFCIYFLVIALLQTAGLWTLLRLENIGLAMALAASPLLLIGAGAVIASIFLPSPPGENLVVLFSMLGVGGVLMTNLPLFILRLCGCRLIAGNDEPQPPERAIVAALADSPFAEPE